MSDVREDEDATEKASSSSSSSPEQTEVCSHLRTKTAHGNFRGGAYTWQSGRSSTAVYWCLRTMENAGPDDGYTHPHTCRAGRICFEP